MWGSTIVALVLLFLSFKRIAFLGVALAIAFDVGISGFMRLRAARAVAVLIVVVLSLVALFSTQIFEYVTTTLSIESTSANSISLGRYDIAVKLWEDLARNKALSWMLGLAPAQPIWRHSPVLRLRIRTTTGSRSSTTTAWSASS